MNKDKVKTILIVLIILILCLNVGVYAAYALAATDVSYTKSNGTTVTVKAALDELYAKVPTYEIGDEVTVGGEQFYVLDWNNDSDTVNLITKYNINGSGISQGTSGGYGNNSCAFSSERYWTSDYKNLNDVSGYSSNDAMGRAKYYGINKGAVSSRLLTVEEFNALNAKVKTNSKIRKMLYGIDDNNEYTNYWLGTVQYNAYDGEPAVHAVGSPYPRSGFFCEFSLFVVYQ